MEGGGKGGLSCGSGSAVSVSETGPSRNQPVSVSERAAGEWRRLHSRVYHTASVCVRVSVFLVFVRLRASVRACVLVISSCQKPGRDLATPSKNFFATLVPACRAVAMMVMAMMMMMEWRENGERSGMLESGNQVESQKSNQIALLI